jgi:CubicO group peptidase (beta-lactamase class C family)
VVDDLDPVAMSAASVTVSGTCDPRFAAVQDAFEKNFAVRHELGAAVAVVHDDELVVDLWAGFKDVARTMPWERDTLAAVASTAKVVATVAGLILIDRGLIEVDEPIATYWPEFAAAGKEAIPVRQIFSHSTGVAGFDAPTSSDVVMGDWDAAVAQLASQAPWWQPGTQSGYHGMSYAYLIGELVRRTADCSYDDFLRTEITGPLDADFTIGVPESERPRVAELEAPDTRVYPDGPDSFAARSEYGVVMPSTGPVQSAWLEGCNPSGLGFATARAVASIGAIFANSGTRLGRQFLSEETTSLAWQEQRYDYDLVMEDRVRWGMGLGLASEEVPLPFPRSVHWGGYGGSVFVADPDSRTSWCYVPNRFVIDRSGDERGNSIGGATVHSILGLS